MIGVVIVSHSAKLAEGVAELADQAAQGRVRVAAAGGTGDAANPIGTDAFRVLEAIESVFGDDGVLVLMDLGSAVLSAETALELLDEARRSRIRLCAAPLVEGAVAAVSVAAAGGGLDEVAREAEQALAAKTAQLGVAEPSRVAAAGGEQREVTLANPLGLHARPAARFIRLARRFDARVTVENRTVAAGPFDAGSLNGILSVGGRQGHRLLLRAEGREASRALAELASFVRAGCGDTDTAAVAPPGTVEPVEDALTGIGASAGIAIGPLVRVRPPVAEVADLAGEDPDAEWHRLQTALSAAREEIRTLYEWTRRRSGENEAGIFDAQALFLEDPELMERARALIFDEGRGAASAWNAAAGALVGRLAGLDDPYLSARAADLKDAGARVLRALTGTREEAVVLREPGVVAAHDLLPSQVEGLDPRLALGVGLESGSASAHSAILARARGIPAVVGLGPVLSTIGDGTIVAIDGERGALWVSPGSGVIEKLEERRRVWLGSRASARASEPCATRDGHRITVLANLRNEAEAADAVAQGAEGVGVLRTEFLFLDRKTAPSEDEQFEAYRNIAAALGDRPLVIRTLDIGGDKSVPYVDIGAEANPFLGWRGIRLTLGRRDLFETQLRAILRAAAGHRVEILLPMISSLAELREAKAVVRDLGGERTPVGVMIEVPAAAAIADRLAAEASRLSIGTNDLVQYVMAADRTNSRVARTADHFQPAVLRTIHHVVESGRRAGIPVDVCGEMGADTLATPVLLGLGVAEFSVSPPLIPDLKRAVRRWALAEAQAMAHAALAADSSEDVRELLRRSV